MQNWSLQKSFSASQVSWFEIRGKMKISFYIYFFLLKQYKWTHFESIKNKLNKQKIKGFRLFGF